MYPDISMFIIVVFKLKSKLNFFLYLIWLEFFSNKNNKTKHGTIHTMEQLRRQEFQRWSHVVLSLSSNELYTKT